MHLAENSNWRRINLDDLRFAGHTIEDTSTGEKFKRYRGELLEAVNLPIIAWAITVFRPAVPGAGVTHTVTIKLAPVLTADRFRNPDWDRPDRTLYWRGALQFLPNRSEVPLFVDHDLTRQIGVMDTFFELDWIDGEWICAVGTIGDPPAWIERHHTKASFGHWDVTAARTA